MILKNNYLWIIINDQIRNNNFHKKCPVGQHKLTQLGDMISYKNAYTFFFNTIIFFHRQTFSKKKKYVKHEKNIQPQDIKNSDR